MVTAIQDQSSSQYTQLRQQRYSHHLPYQQQQQQQPSSRQSIADDARSCSSDGSQNRRCATTRSQQLMYCGSSTADSDAGQYFRCLPPSPFSFAPMAFTSPLFIQTDIF